MLLPLLPTKLYAPTPRPNQIHRAGLMERIDADGLYPLTLIAAPAGAGKTSLVAAWAAQRKQAVAWLTLQEDDNDIGRFLTYLLAALRPLATTALGEPILALLQSPQPPALRALLNMLAHTLIADLSRCVLVLDDYHVITNQAIHDTVSFLLEQVPTLRWIITTRADPALPLGRLRARQQLLELRSADLCFTLAETTALFNELLQLGLTGTAVEELQRKTEGWVAGLQLAGLALQHSENRSDFVREFLGSHRYIADYLTDEVLHQLSPQMQHFLLQTAILERICADVCATVIGDWPTADNTTLPNVLTMSTTQAQCCLEELEHANLFLMPLDDHRHWYRYHPLFADLLRQRLQRQDPQLVFALHRRAAVWFAQHNLLDDAIPHAIAGEDFSQAADLLDQNNEQFWMQGRFVTLRHWLAVLPDSVKEQRPRLLLAQAWTAVLTDAPLSTTEALLQRAEKAIVSASAGQPSADKPATTEWQGVLATIRAIYHSKQEDVAGILLYAQQALAQLPSQVGSWRGIAQLCLGFAQEMNGTVQGAQQNFAEAIRLCRMNGNHYSTLVGIMRLARAYLVQGQLQLAAVTYQEGLAEATQRGMAQLPNTAHAHIYLGRIYYEWNNLTEAAAQLQRGLAFLPTYGASWLQFDGHLLLARVQQALGKPGEALAHLQLAEQVAQALPFAWTKVATASALVQMRLALRQEIDAERWLAQAAPTPQDPLDRVRESEHLVAVRVLVAHGRIDEALALLTHLTQVTETAGRLKIVVECAVLTAVAHYQSGDFQAAQTVLQGALILAEPERYIRTFVDEGAAIQQLLGTLQSVITEAHLQTYIEQLLAAYGGDIVFKRKSFHLSLRQAQGTVETLSLDICSTGQSEAPTLPLATATAQPPPLPTVVATQALVESLSPRELEILQLMAAGLSNQEIADRLIITLGTVKSHANHIFGKLGVQGRVKAINQARALALL